MIWVARYPLIISSSRRRVFTEGTVARSAVNRDVPDRIDIWTHSVWLGIHNRSAIRYDTFWKAALPFVGSARMLQSRVNQRVGHARMGVADIDVWPVSVTLQHRNLAFVVVRRCAMDIILHAPAQRLAYWK